MTAVNPAIRYGLLGAAGTLSFVASTRALEKSNTSQVNKAIIAGLEGAMTGVLIAKGALAAQNLRTAALGAIGVGLTSGATLGAGVSLIRG